MTTAGRRRRVLLVGALAVVVVVAAVLVTARLVTGRPSDGVHPGRAWEVTGFTDDDAPEVGVVELPVGSLHVRVGEPVGELPWYETQGTAGEDARSGRDAAFVPVAWTLDPASVAGEPTYAYDVVLVADGVSHDLRAGESDQTAPAAGGAARAKALWVTVGGEATDLAVEVTYEGITQTLDVDSGDVESPGASAALYEPRQVSLHGGCALAPAPGEEPAGGFVADSGDLGCEGYAPPGTGPYHPRLGWVDDPARRYVWLTVRVPAPARARGDDGDELYLGLVGADVLLDGEPPVLARVLRQDYYALHATYVFETAAPPGGGHDLEVRARVRAADLGPGPEPAPFTLVGHGRLA